MLNGTSVSSLFSSWSTHSELQLLQVNFLEFAFRKFWSRTFTLFFKQQVDMTVSGTFLYLFSETISLFTEWTWLQPIDRKISYFFKVTTWLQYVDFSGMNILLVIFCKVTGMVEESLACWRCYSTQIVKDREKIIHSVV